MNRVVVTNLVKSFAGEQAAVKDVSVSVREGETVALLGPSGCGKTTTLRCIAGLETADSGGIVVDGKEVMRNGQQLVAPERRRVGFVFQSYSLWPHMTVRQNIGLGLKARGLKSAVIEEKVRNALDLVRLSDYIDRPATDLSGGQQQRVALARSLALEPRVLLLDEPLSNLDSALREELQFELRDLLAGLGITAVYVTHDQKEAFILADRIVVMRDGVVVQEGPATELYRRPRNQFVANFIGSGNVLEGTVRSRRPGFVSVDLGGGQTISVAGEAPDGQPVELCLRPEQVHIGPGDAAHPNAERLDGTIRRSVYLGRSVECLIDVGRNSLRVVIPAEERVGVTDLAVGSTVPLWLAPDSTVLLEPDPAVGQGAA